MDFTISELYIACDDIDFDSTNSTIFYVHAKIGDYLWFNPAEGFIYCGTYDDMPNEIRHANVDRFTLTPKGAIRVLLYKNSSLED